ncbi:hypothetical protein AYK26_02645 [Euryarchaeota archaeon SM23-78]|nr:MAG: hypothetical protein AYK26_02645 [Euryarchaeota archaeon SM23-78]MBW3000270.1 DUF4190 domain-containing protein [Candidatus Woesearchaeota archaeon]
MVSIQTPPQPPPNSPPTPPSRSQSTPLPRPEQPTQAPQLPTEQKTNVMAILSLIFALLFPLLGLIFGIIALVQIKKDPNQKGKGLAVTGIILSIVLPIIIFVLIVTVFLAYYGVMEPTAFIPTRCTIEAGFDCFDYNIGADGTVTFSLFNAQGRDISSVTVTVENECTPAGVAISNGETVKFTCPGTPGISGETYSQDITIKYLLSGGTYEQTATGILSARYP